MQLKSCLILLLLIYSEALWAQKAITSKDGVQINGLEQYLEINGKDPQKPLLLFLHGGPGFSSRSYFNPIKKGLQKDFIVVQWDHRETGITKAWNSAPKPITLDQMHQDTEEVIDYLLKRFDRQKIYLVGFSWGGYLGFTYARNHPKKLHAYIAVSAMISNLDSEEITLEFIKSRAEEEGLTEAIQELEDVSIPFQNIDQLYLQRKWTAYFSSDKSKNKSYPRGLFDSWAPVWFDIFLKASQEDFRESTPTLDCPVFFIASRKDLVANYNLAQDYFDLVKAPKKELIWFEESTHEIPSQEPNRFIEELVRIGDNRF